VRKGEALERVAVIATVLALACLVVPPIREGRPWLQRGWLDAFLFESGWKQVSGYVALAIALFGSTLALRKRIRSFTFGKYETWQVVHALTGSAAAAVIVLHTGFRLGVRFNAVFMLIFSAVLASGAIIGALTPLYAQSRVAQSVRATHQLLVWLLPPLVAVHVLTVYYF
jgi:nitrite reductase (NADH) large subunit